MGAKVEPLIPFGDDATKPLLSPSDPASDGSQFDLDQLRQVLINGGVTSRMLGLPEDEDLFEDNDLPEDEDQPEGTRKKRRRTRLRRNMNKRARRRQERLHDDGSGRPIAEDIYNMFFLSKNWSLPFWCALGTACDKFLLYGIVLYWIYKPDGWSYGQHQLLKKVDVGGPDDIIVRITQLLLIPVAIGITEELLITADVISSMRWGEVDGCPHATRRKFWIATILRAFDGLSWLFVIISLLFHAVDILDMFLNFAALQFLQCVDNAMYDMAARGLLPWECQEVTRQVAKTKLPSIEGTWKYYLDAILLWTVMVVCFIMWGVVNFVYMKESLTTSPTSQPSALANGGWY